ncbi:alpha/beta hydrolase [Gammaproteobacteria bacterium]|jgi:acetyl esterase|nr:alpha/beta hydrolase [Gammaproteobacteria bacterium]
MLIKLLLSLPNKVLIWLSRKEQITTKGGRKLDPGFQFLLSFMGGEDSEDIDHSLPAAEQRKQTDEALKPLWALSAPLPNGTDYIDHQVPSDGASVRVREYFNNNLEKNAPALIYFHGGGWVFFNIESHHTFTGSLSDILKAKVFSVDYRLAPENPYPAALNDFDAVFDWVESNYEELGIDPKRISVGGDSAGGNLSAAISIRRQAENKTLPKAQLLIYPVTDLTFSFDSIEELAKGFLLSKENMYWFREQYLEDHNTVKDPLISPLFSEDLSGQPPVVIVTAGFDVLRDEGDAYANLLKKFKVETYHHSFDGYIHGFVNMEMVSGVNEAIVKFCKDFKKIY